MLRTTFVFLTLTTLPAAASSYVDALFAWSACVEAEMKRLIPTDTTPQDIATTALGSCVSEEQVARQSFVEKEIRLGMVLREPTTSKNAEAKFARMNVGFKDQIVTLVVQARTGR